MRPNLLTNLDTIGSNPDQSIDPKERCMSPIPLIQVALRHQTLSNAFLLRRDPIVQYFPFVTNGFFTANKQPQPVYPVISEASKAILYIASGISRDDEEVPYAVRLVIVLSRTAINVRQ